MVEVSIVPSGRGSISSARVRPLSFGITPAVHGNTITFSLSQPRNLSVEVDGDIFRNLHLLARPIETDRPDPTDPNVLYYGPGVHRVGTVLIPSGKTVYIAGGALVQGRFLVSHAENVRIRGRGILTQYPSRRRSRAPRRPAATGDALSRREPCARGDALTIEFFRNVKVDGLIVTPTGYTVLVGQSQG